MSVAVDRKAYGINDSRELRKVSLLGSTNELDILKDPTGNRRILPIKVDSIKYDECLSFDSKALLAEAYKLWKDGFEWVIRKEEDLAMMQEENDEFPGYDDFAWHYSSESGRNDQNESDQGSFPCQSGCGIPGNPLL